MSSQAVQRASTPTAQETLQLEALLLARDYSYTLFHKLLGTAPNAALLSALLDETTADIFSEYSEDSPELAQFAKLLASLREGDFESLLDSVRDEYTRIFVGPAMLPASPYESPYIGSHDMATFQQNTIEVRTAYREQGLQMKKLLRMPDDHVAALCNFMTQLSTRSLQTFRDGTWVKLVEDLRWQARFTQAHLANWLDEYARAVRNSKAGSQAVLYPQLLEALAAFAKIDTAFAAESSYWLAQQETPAANGATAPELAAAQQSLDALASIRPYGVEDNELTCIDQ